jgi:hypothetical protein
LPDPLNDHIARLNLEQLEALALVLLQLSDLAELEEWLSRC